jgi:hypothetical protein
MKDVKASVQEKYPALIREHPFQNIKLFFFNLIFGPPVAGTIALIIPK